MTNQQIAQELKDKGFEVTVSDTFVIARLNRRVEVMEVEIALNFNIPNESIVQLNDKVAIFGID